MECEKRFHSRTYLSFVKSDKFFHAGVEPGFFLKKTSKGILFLKQIICTVYRNYKLISGKRATLVWYKNEKSEDYSKADLKQRVLFFVTIFRVAIPAFFRFTDVTELV